MEQEVVRMVVPDDEQDEFRTFLGETNLVRIRQVYLTWKHNVLVKQKAEKQARFFSKDIPIVTPSIGRGKASDWRDVARGTRSVQ